MALLAPWVEPSRMGKNSKSYVSLVETYSMVAAFCSFPVLENVAAKLHGCLRAAHCFTSHYENAFCNLENKDLRDCHVRIATEFLRRSLCCVLDLWGKYSRWAKNRVADSAGLRRRRVLKTSHAKKCHFLNQQVDVSVVSRILLSSSGITFKTFE